MHNDNKVERKQRITKYLQKCQWSSPEDRYVVHKKNFYSLALFWLLFWLILCTMPKTKSFEGVWSVKISQLFSQQSINKTPKKTANFNDTEHRRYKAKPKKRKKRKEKCLTLTLCQNDVLKAFKYPIMIYYLRSCIQ